MALARQGMTMRLPAARGIDEAEAADRAVPYRTERYLVGCRPFAVIGHEIHRPGPFVRSALVARDAVGLPEILRQLPRAVRRLVFEREQQVTAGEWQRARRKGAEVSVLAAREREHRLLPVEVAELGGAGSGKIAELRVVRALVVGDALDQLRDHEVEVHVALAVPVRRHVDRHPLDLRQEIGAVVEVESAQEVLVRLPVSGVLSRDQARDDLENLAGAQERPVLELLVENRAFARRARRARECNAAGGYDDFIEVRGRHSAGKRLAGCTGQDDRNQETPRIHVLITFQPIIRMHGPAAWN